MKIKSIVKTLFWVLFITCTFQFSLMLPTYAVEQKARTLASTYSAQFPVEQQAVIQNQFEQNYLEAISNQTVLSIPYVTDLSYGDLKEQQLQLGLDLKGGMQVLLSINKSTFLQDLVEDFNNPHFNEAILLTNEQLASTDPNYIAVFFDQFQSLEQEEAILRFFQKSPLLKEVLSSETDIQTLQKEVNTLLSATLLTTQYQLTERLNSLGLSQPTISADIGKQQLHIEVPGAVHPERIRSIVTSTASLEFWETYRITDEGIWDAFVKADQILSTVQKK